MDNFYPGSSVMREQGWNPYKEEEEMTQSVQVGSDRYGSNQRREMWRDSGRRREEDWGWEGKNRWENDRDREDESWFRRDQRRDRESWPVYDRKWDRKDCRRTGGWEMAACRNGQPYQRCDHMSILQEEQNMEKELRRLQSMYPQAARDILPMVEDACDQMEYEGSMMFDEMPDQNAVRKMSDGIYDKVRELYPEETGKQEQKDEILSMQYQARRRRPSDGDFLRDLVQVMLIQEMHRRRCRHHRCRRF